MGSFKKWTDFNKRLLVSITLLAILALLIIFSSQPIIRWMMIGVIALLVGVGVWEYAQLAKGKRLELCQKLMVITAIITALSFALTRQFSHYATLPGFILFFSLLSFFIYHFKENYQALVLVAVEFFGICYVAIPLSCISGLIFLPGGKWWITYLILVTKITDIGGYFFGKLYGKRKLAPKLSPHKTIEGGIAGFFCAILMSLFLVFFTHTFFNDTFFLSYFDGLILGILLGVLGQIGDLAESLLKRDAEVKDSNTLPGLGGVLDMVDSLLFTAPIVYLFAL